MTNLSSSTQPQPSSKSRLSAGLVIATALLTVASFVDAPYPRELRLQHAPTFLALAGLALAIRYGWLRFSSIVGVLVFLWLHILGARWIYSFVPYDEQAEAYNGQQGDIWDPQKDLLMAAIGSVIAAAVVWRRGIAAERHRDAVAG